MSLTFYYAPGACSLGVHIALEETGAAYEAVRVLVADGEQRQPAYLAINPAGRIPALVVDGKVLTECTAIHTYLAHRFPESGLLPLDDAFLTARATEVMSWLASTLHISFAQVWRGERFTDDAAARAALQADGPARVRAHFQRLEQRLADSGGPWILGDRYSAADAYALVFHRWGPRLGIDMADYPAWTAQAARLYQRPAVRRALEQEGLAPILSVAA